MSKIALSLSLTFVVGTQLSFILDAQAQSQSNKAASQAQSQNQPTAIPDLDKARENTENNPSSPDLSFKFAEALRLNGESVKANHQYLHTTEVEPAFYLAYHQLFLHCNDERILDEAINRLRFLKQDKPNELMLRVALSELLEKKREFYEASRELIDLVFTNLVPEKYKEKVNTRIRYLQAKTTTAQSHREANAGDAHLGESISKPPLPVNEDMLKRGMSLSKVKFDTPDLDSDANFRHVPLQD